MRPLDPIFQNMPNHLIGFGKGRHLKIGGLTKEEEAGLRSVVELTINGISGGLKNTG